MKAPDAPAAGGFSCLAPESMTCSVGQSGPLADQERALVKFAASHPNNDELLEFDAWIQRIG